jgi:ribosomal protein L16 Arg81 hydroxylase
MTAPIADLAQLLDPVTPEAFFRDHHLKRPLHIPAPRPDKLAGVMGWDDLSAILSQAGAWTSHSLELVLDHRKVPPHEYCRPGVGREGGQQLLADLELVSSWLRRGASLVLNDIDTLTPGLKAAADALEKATGGKVQSNLYCSWKAHPAFGSHFDTHDVYALHLAGEKTWRVYGRHIEDPIAHPAFKQFGQEYHDRHRGAVTMEVTLRPGDVLYLPRGWYHDAVASSEATFHVAFGVTPVIGLDLLSLMFEAAVQDPLFRKAFPPASDRAAVAAHLAALGARLSLMSKDPGTVDRMIARMAEQRYRRGAIRLPDDALDRRWRRKSASIRVETVQGRPVITDGKQGAPVPAEVADAVAWTLGRDGFAEAEFAAAFPAMAEGARSKLLADLAAMKVLVAG